MTPHIREKNFIHGHLPIHNQFSWFVLSQNTDPHLKCRVTFFQAILPWLSFQIWPGEDYWKICELRWLPRCLVWINDHEDASSGLETAKNCMGRDLASTVYEVTVQNWCFRGILAPITPYGDTHYPGARSTSFSIGTRQKQTQRYITCTTTNTQPAFGCVLIKGTTKFTRSENVP